MVAYSYNSSTQEANAGGLLQVRGHPELPVVKPVFRKTQNVSKSGVTVHEPRTAFGVEGASTRDLKINPSCRVSLGS